MIYDRTMIVIRERSFMDLLDLALVVVRGYPVTVGLAAAAGIVPFAALNCLAAVDPGVSSLLYGSCSWPWKRPWATAPLTLALGDLMFGVRLRPRRIFIALVTSLPALVVTQILVRGLFLATVVVYPLMPAQYGFLDEVVMLERAPRFRSWKSLKRSRAL